MIQIMFLRLTTPIHVFTMAQQSDWYAALWKAITERFLRTE